jgi:hypothetical protein
MYRRNLVAAMDYGFAQQRRRTKNARTMAGVNENQQWQ